MTNLKNTYGLKAFPTEKTFKEFKPVRGMRFQGPIELTAEDLTLHRSATFQRELDPKAWSGTRLVPDVTPIFRLIAEKMGYDLAALLEGKGETGQPADAWTIYADEGRLPMLIRWTIGEAQLLLTIAIAPKTFGEPRLDVLLLADEAARPKLPAIGEALGLIERDILPPLTTDVPAGDLLEQVRHVGGPWHDFSLTCSMRMDHTQPLEATHAEALAELRNSAEIIILSAESPFGREVKLGEMRVTNRRERVSPMHYARGERISREFLMILRDWGVSDVTKAMQNALATHLAEQRHLTEGTTPTKRDRTPTIDHEVAEREARLELTVRAFTEPKLERKPHATDDDHVMDSFRRRLPSLGQDFIECPGEVLRGTGPELKSKHGDVMRAPDLLWLLTSALCAIPEQYPSRGQQTKGVKLSGVMEVTAIAEQYKDTAPEKRKFSEISNPYYEARHGLPVRIDKSVMVWRKGLDTEALAADFFYAPESKDLHIANLYRVKVPVEKE